MGRMSANTMNDYAEHAIEKAEQAINARNLTRARRCISILCDIRNQADISGFTNEN